MRYQSNWGSNVDKLIYLRWQYLFFKTISWFWFYGYKILLLYKYQNYLFPTLCLFFNGQDETQYLEKESLKPWVRYLSSIISILTLLNLWAKSKAFEFHGHDSKGREICCRILVKLKTVIKISIIISASRTYSKILRLQSSTSLLI